MSITCTQGDCRINYLSAPFLFDGIYHSPRFVLPKARLWARSAESLCAIEVLLIDWLKQLSAWHKKWLFNNWTSLNSGRICSRFRDRCFWWIWSLKKPKNGTNAEKCIVVVPDVDSKCWVLVGRRYRRLAWVRWTKIDPTLVQLVVFTRWFFPFCCI